MSVALARTPAAKRNRRPAAKGLARIGYLIGGWSLMIIAPFVGILPGPGGIPVFLAGLIVVLRHSHRARRLFIKLQHRFPKLLNPVRQLLKTGFRDPKTGKVIDVLGIIGRFWATVGRILTPWRRRPA